ncbi:hypothetical protein LSAT2_002577 [Lamellibrachia satsuma]|nr:hypothetical protein LSAT2_002577 [Lamellibrachia satsuma]
MFGNCFKFLAVCRLLLLPAVIECGKWRKREMTTVPVPTRKILILLMKYDSFRHECNSNNHRSNTAQMLT